MLQFIENLKKENNILFLSSNLIKNKLIKLTSSYLNDFTFKSYAEFKEDLVGKIDNLTLLNNYHKNDDYTFENLEIVLQNKLLKEKLNINPDLLNYYKSKQIYVINYNHNDDLVNILLTSFDNITYKNLENDKQEEKDVLCFNDYEEEIIYAVNDIAKKINEKTDPSKIVIYYSNSDYLKKLEEILIIYQIDYQTDIKEKLIDFETSKEFLKFLKNHFNNKIEDICNEYLKIHNDDVSLEIINHLSDIIDKKLDDNTYELINYIFNKTTKKTNEYQNAITLCNDFDNIYDEQTHIYILGCANNILFSFVKDTQYLKNEERQKYNLLTSDMRNQNTIKQIVSFINYHKNIYLSYSKTVHNKKYFICHFLENKKLTNRTLDIADIISARMAQNIYQKAYRLYNLYNEKSENLDKGYETFNKKYNLYNSEYSGNENISEDVIKLSYSKIDDYTNCPFKYYLKNYLKLPEKENESTELGSLIHFVLEKVLKNMDNNKRETLMNDISCYFDEYFSEKKYQKTNKDEIYFPLYLKQLQNIIPIIIDFMDNSNFTLAETESSFEIKLDDKTILNGKIDKILVYEDYFIVVDYKTGNVDFDWKNLDQGVKLQLPIYLLLYSETHHGMKPAGAYLENVFKKSFFDELKDIIKAHAYKGYTNNDNDINLRIDISERNKGLIKYNKTNAKNLAFIPESVFLYVIDYTKKKVLEIASDIRNNKFNIKPLYDGSTLKGCEYCNYKDICYRLSNMKKWYTKNENLDYLKKDNQLEEE